MKRTKLKSLVFLLLAWITWPGYAQTLESPYGVTSQVTWSWEPYAEFQTRERTFARMNEASANWVRCQFDWLMMENPRGKWNFSMFDTLVSDAKKAQIHLLPILGFDNAWGELSHKSPYWNEYVRTVVSRYKNDIRAWQVGNEPNWGGPANPTAEEYAKQLKQTYQTIKSIDPALTVVTSGFAGIPRDYLETLLKNGLSESCDVVAVQPYHASGVPEEILPDLTLLKTLMKQYNCQKPIWLTEIGWSTGLHPRKIHDMFAAAIKEVGIDPTLDEAAFVCDADNNVFTLSYLQSSGFPSFSHQRIISLNQIKVLDPKRTPLLVPCIDEVFIGKYIPDLLSYVRRGGTILLPNAFPFFYDKMPNGDKKIVSDKYIPLFHLGWDWYHSGNVPRVETFQRPAPEFEGKYQWQAPAAKSWSNGRYLHTRNMKPGDKFIPVLLGGNEQFTGPIAGIYKLNSNLKGNIIISVLELDIRKVSELEQAKVLPRTYLLMLSNGVERVLWYSFRSTEADQYHSESHFGLFHKNNDPKPAFYTFKTLGALCPSGSTVPEMKVNAHRYSVTWKRPDGVRVWALWRPLGKENVKLIARGEIQEILDMFGKKMSATKLGEGEFTLSDSVTYVIGPELISIEPLR